MIKNESILDQPKEGLDAQVWEKKEDGNFHLTESAKSKIYILMEWALRRLGVSDYGVNIIGSITSNQYKEDSDIDVHVNSKDIPTEKSDEVNKMLRKEFEEFKVQNEDVVFIGKHPLEIYFQSNPYQDMMSVGCYDVINEKWLVGPDLKDIGFDPYAEYYDDDMKYVEDVIKDIRNVILEGFESAIAIKNSKNENFKKFETQHLKEVVSRAAEIFTNAREYRKITSAPTDEKTAQDNRNSRKWKIADSSFKLLDKFGYLAIMRTMTQCHEKLQSNEISNEQAVDEIISSIQDNLAKNANLDEEHKGIFEDVECGNIHENLAKQIGIFSIIASMIGLPGVSSAQTLKDNGDKIPQQIVNVAKGVNVNDDFGGLSYPKMVNLVATIMYNEAMIDYKNYKDDKCLIAIGNVIENRSGKDPKRFVKTISKNGAFYSTKEVRGGYSNKDYKEYFPGFDREGNKVAYNKDCWKKCVQYAIMTVNGTLPNVIGNRNMIANRKLDNEKAWNSWGKNADVTIGSHSFGYEKSEDGFLKENR